MIFFLLYLGFTNLTSLSDDVAKGEQGKPSGGNGSQVALPKHTFQLEGGSKLADIIKIPIIQNAFC